MNSANSANGNGNGNGHGRIPIEVLEPRLPRIEQFQHAQIKPRPIWPATLLFLLTVLSTLIVGSEFALSYMQNREPFSTDETLVQMIVQPLEHPNLLALGVPFSFTLLSILMAHELGHYFACRIYGIDASYPYFIPAPTLFGTFGAFIRIRSPITTRKALFDVGLSGPVVGFILAVPAIAYGVAQAKVVPNVHDTAVIVFGTPLLMRWFIDWFHPGVNPSWILVSPIARAAWVGLFATALNLLPVWQLDGGHIVYSLSSKLHQRISLGVGLALVVSGVYAWRGWIFWGLLLTVLALRFKHPPLYDPWERLGRARWIGPSSLSPSSSSASLPGPPAPRSPRRALDDFAAKFLARKDGIRLSPVTNDVAVARKWFRMGTGLDGIVAKRDDLPYQTGQRTGMQKIKKQRTADCVVGGFRYLEKKPLVGSLLLGLYDSEGKLNHVGFTSSIHNEDRKSLTKKLESLIKPPGFTGKAPGGLSRWSTKRSMSWEPLEPKLVVEVQFDHFTGGRFRHGTKFLRWREDKKPSDCTMEQVRRENKSALDLL